MHTAAPELVPLDAAISRFRTLPSASPGTPPHSLKVPGAVAEAVRRLNQHLRESTAATIQLQRPEVQRRAETALDSAAGELWNRLPPLSAALLGLPESWTAVLIDRSVFDQVGEFQAVTAPVWDWLIRAAELTHEIPPLLTDAEPLEPVTSRLRPSRPGPEWVWLPHHLSQANSKALFPQVASETDAFAYRAGLYLWHDHLDESHRLSQSIEGEGRHRAGDYWHAIMHRRDGDYSNSKYWLRSVGKHPLFVTLAPAAQQLWHESRAPGAEKWSARLFGSSGWSATAFVDLCEACENAEDEPLGQIARQLQDLEMRRLLTSTFADATGTGLVSSAYSPGLARNKKPRRSEC